MKMKITHSPFNRRGTETVTFRTDGDKEGIGRLFAPVDELTQRSFILGPIARQKGVLTEPPIETENGKKLYDVLHYQP